MYDYIVLEERLNRLLKSLEGLFSSSETSDVQEFLDAGEYGLALETICAIIIEDGKGVGSEVIKEVKAVGDMMELDSDIVRAFLNSRPSNE